MNSQIRKLASIAEKQEKRILGLMSGTSMDGLDIAMCNIIKHGADTQLSIEHFTTVPFDDEYTAYIKPLFANPNARLMDVSIANALVARTFAKCVNTALKDWRLSAEDIDLVASHGQTIFHAPQHFHQQSHLPDATMQIGDGDHIAHLTGIITISDFRQKHIAAGGEGAPMVKYGDALLFAHPSESRVLLNLGGIANLSFIPASARFGDIISTDTGPANTLMDAAVQANDSTKRYDNNGDLAASGKVNSALLTCLLKHPFFNIAAPKTTGQESFSYSWLVSMLDEVNSHDIALSDLLATLASLSANSIVDCLKSIKSDDQHPVIYVSGGGARNQHLLNQIQSLMPDTQINNLETLGMDSDAKEAALFALLANECVSGEASSSFVNDQGSPAVSMGKISLPN